ncbi:MAG: virulence RhuM family protein [Candidatus Nomurabacteria bacterium]|jgi:hypothetical protein|nr:virulence RhuM family protein [Candidatus Nomurabacteria bacterium]
MKKLSVKNSTIQFLKFVSEREGDNIDILFTRGDLWASQKMISMLFGVGVPAISKHIKNILADRELGTGSVISNLETTARDGKNYDVDYYNLDMIISIGYRVNSEQAVNFRRWATGVLKEFARKGYIIDRKRMENGRFFDEDYFEHLLAEIREIRLSERRFYQKVTDIFATSSDYDNKTITAQNFFATVQNKFHYAIHEHTAAELIIKRAKRGIPMTMRDWAKRLDVFLKADDHKILLNAGKITAEIAKQHAESEFEKYRVTQDRLFESDFDSFVKRLV